MYIFVPPVHSYMKLWILLSTFDIQLAQSLLVVDEGTGICLGSETEKSFIDMHAIIAGTNYLVSPSFCVILEIVIF